MGFTVATVATFVVSGIGVPNAIGAVRDRGVESATQHHAAGVAAAAMLRQRVAREEHNRASRNRTAQTEALQAAQENSRRAFIAAKEARPKWVLPISGYHLTAGFGQYGLWSHAHTGQDFAAPYGTPVKAAGDGTVIFAGYDGAYGNKIAIQHTDGTVTWYAHLSAIVVGSGNVTAGQLIGNVGSTGNTTGPHLHFEVRPHDGAPIDPMPWLRIQGLHP